jgi:DNA-binding transcriptional LysR family regulator
MKLEFLLTLDAILRKGTFAGAAEEVGLTTSAVSLQVKRLEDYLGQPLFDRSSRTAKPNALARELAAAMRSALHAMETARTRPTPSVSGRLVIGTIRTVQAIDLPRALGYVSSRHPQLSVRAVQGNSDELLSRLKAGSLDAAVVIRPAAGGSTRLHWVDLEKQPFVLVAPPGSHGATPGDLIARHPWIQYDTTLTGGRFAASFLRRYAPKKSATFELGSIEAIVTMVSSGLGVSIVPKLQMATAPLPVREIALGRHAPVRQISFVCRAADRENRRISAISDAFARAFKR